MRRGFKAESERLSEAVRAELGLALEDRLDCHELAAHLGIPTVPLTQLERDGARQASISQLLDPAADFSALTLCVGSRRLVVFHPGHPAGRRANSLAHELAHVLLEHPPAPVVGSGGCRHWNAEHEEEADWQAGALLVPREGALTWLRARAAEDDIAHHFGVSLALLRWRVNHTGLARQLARARTS